MKKYILIAGVNGAGKSTLYHLLPELLNLPRINSDEIVKEFGHWYNNNDVMKAGIITVKKLNQYIASGISFNQETTLCGKSIINNIKKAKRMGYVIEMHYVGVDSAQVAKERVAYRVKNGGHGIPDSDIDRRFGETFRNLKEILPYCDQITFYDNTYKFERFAVYKNGQPERVSVNTPEWFKNLHI